MNASSSTIQPVGRPSALCQKTRLFIDELLGKQEDMPVSELLRRLRSDHGYTRGHTAVYEYVKAHRPKACVLPVVRFEGVAGEFSQNDFGEVRIRYTDASKDRLHFFCGRLKYSRFMHVELVEDQKMESVIRGMLAFFEACGGMAVINVWDQPRTIVVGRQKNPDNDRQEPILNPTFRQFIHECAVLSELCHPASGNQKGCVESLVKFVKRSFFLARRFKNRQDLLAQLSEWLHTVNYQRPCSATGQIPAERLLEELPRLRPLPFTKHTYGILVMRTVGPDARIPLDGLQYAVDGEWIGSCVEVRVFPQSVVIHHAGKSISHPRYPTNGKYSLLPEQRKPLFVKPRGAIMAKRQILMDLCPQAQAFFTELVHKRPLAWREADLPVLWELFEQHGEAWMRDALAACVAEGLFGAEYVQAISQELLP